MLRALARLLAVPDKLAMLGLVRGMGAQMQLGVASALHRSGVMEHLQTPRTLEELAAAAGVAEREVLHHLLELGVRRRLLRCRGGRYSARSRMARTVAREPRGAFASMLQEVTTYHQEVFHALPERLRGQPPQDFLARYGAVVASSSRIMAPWICGFTAEVLGRAEGKNILELGCGAGAYLVFYAGLHDQHCGVGLDFDGAVVDAAQRAVAAAQIQDRFVVRQGDMRDAQGWPEGPFDTITAHQNVYYFDAEQRVALWRACHARLAHQGCLVVVTPTSGGPMSDYFALILQSTAGCHRLPSVEELTSELTAAGFEIARRERLIPGDAVWGIAARKAAATMG